MMQHKRERFYSVSQNLLRQHFEAGSRFCVLVFVHFSLSVWASVDGNVWAQVIALYPTLVECITCSSPEVSSALKDALGPFKDFMQPPVSKVQNGESWLNVFIPPQTWMWLFHTPRVRTTIHSHRHGKLLIDSSKFHHSKLLLRLRLADFNNVLTAMLNLQCLLFLWVFGSPHGVNVQCLVIVLKI